MPITPFQRAVLQLLRKHRNPNSYVAGGVAIHRSSTSSRKSNDIDFFHDTDEAVTQGARIDRELLAQNNYQVQTLIEQPSFVRVVISKDCESLKLEWVRDTAFRFFPVVEDDELGYRLHDVDLAVNKCLALANRNEVRDIVDLIQIHHNVLTLSATCWAACGKDPGFTPELILDYIRRHSIIRPEQLAAESLVTSIPATKLKSDWLAILDQTAQNMALYPVVDLGCVYLDSHGEVVRAPESDPNFFRSEFKHLRRSHFGSVGGSWPRMV